MTHENEDKPKRKKRGIFQQRDRIRRSKKKYENVYWEGLHDINEKQPLELSETDRMYESQHLYYRDPDTIDRANEVRDAYKVLNDRERKIIQMIGEDGKSQEEVARFFRVTRSTIETTLNVIRVKIQRHIKYEKIREEVREKYL